MGESRFSNSVQPKPSSFQSRASKLIGKVTGIRVRGRSRSKGGMNSPPYQISESPADTDHSSRSTSPYESTHRRSRHHSCDTIQPNANRDASTIAQPIHDGPLYSRSGATLERDAGSQVLSTHKLLPESSYRPSLGAQNPSHTNYSRPTPGDHDPEIIRKELPTRIGCSNDNNMADAFQQPEYTAEAEWHPSSNRVGSPPTSSVSMHLSPALALPTLPPAFLNRVGAPRLTPTIIIRTPPMALHLPTLPPQVPLLIPTHPRAPLRSMPTLSVHGTADRPGESDHENACLGDTDEEDTDPQENDVGEGTGSDNDGDQSVESTQSSSSRQPRTGSPIPQRSLLPVIDTSRIDLSFLDHDHDAASEKRRCLETEMTPTATHSCDYFSARPDPQGSSSRSPTRTPRPGDTLHSPLSIMRTPLALPISPPKVAPIAPAMRRHASKSMENFSSTFQQDTSISDPTTIKKDKGGIGSGKGKAREPSNTVPNDIGSISPDPPKRTNEGSNHDGPTPFRRMRSMPTFKRTSGPPPYTILSVSKNAFIMPREDEGRERLPPYSNSIYLSAIMPRKMEFIAPGVQAKDRKWRRVLCVLEGTVFRIHECPREAAGVGPIGIWWEKRVGVGDISAPANTVPTNREVNAEGTGRRNLEGRNKSGWKNEPDAQERNETPQQPERSGSPSTINLNKPKRNRAASLLKPPRGKDASVLSHSRSRSDISPEMMLPRPPSRSVQASYPSTLPTNVDSTSVPPTQSSSSSPSHSTVSSRMEKRAPDPVDAVLLRAYTMQHAESGLGNDYLKRRNVIRVRLEGEQFLLQAMDVPTVIAWIEGLQSAANIALDLDERTMPKGPLFPRRRRRRANREQRT